MVVPKISGGAKLGGSMPPRWTPSAPLTPSGRESFGRKFSKLRRWLDALKTLLPRRSALAISNVLMRSGRRQLRRGRRRIRFAALLRKRVERDRR